MTRPAAVDPRLIERFALFRQPQRGELEADRSAALAQVDSSPVSALFRLVGSLARVVRLTAAVVVAVPGAHGVVLLLCAPDGGWTGFGAPVETVLRGRPVGSSGRLVFGMAPDGVARQSVRLADGADVDVTVVENVWAFEDPSWQPPVFVGE